MKFDMKFDATTWSKKLGLFLALGMGTVLAFFGLMLMLYVVFWGSVIGAVLFLIYMIKERFFPTKAEVIHSSQGRIIEVEEVKVKSRKTN